MKKKLVGAALALATTSLMTGPALAAGPAPSASGSWIAVPSTDPTSATVAFECHAVSVPPAQTRILSAWENGCVLYKGSVIIAKAEPVNAGGASVAAGTARAPLSIPGPIRVCWRAVTTSLTDPSTYELNAACSPISA